MKQVQTQKLKRIKGILLNNWSLKLAALFIACITWLAVMYNLNPIDSKTIIVPVNIINGEELSKSWFFESVGSLEVEVTVEAHSFDLTKIDASDFNFYVDMRYPLGGTNSQKRFQISREVVKNSDLIEKYTLKTDYLDFTFDEIVSREFAVNIVTSGTVAENFTPGEQPTSVPGSITVTGKSSEVDRIKKVVYYLDIKNASEEINETGKPKLLDADDNELTDLESVTISPETIQVCQPIYQTKSVVLSCTSVSGTPATGYGLADILLDVTSVKVAGYKAVLNEFVTLNIPAEMIQIDGLTGSKTFSIDLADVGLPEGVKLVGSNNIVNVTVKIEKMKQNNFRLTLPDDVSMEGKDERFDYTFVNNVVFVTVEGISNDIDNMESKNIAAILDVSGYEEGTFSIELSVKLPEGIDLVVVPEVEVLITAHEEETVPTTQPPTTTIPEPTTTTPEPTTTTTVTEEETEVDATVEATTTPEQTQPEHTEESSTEESSSASGVEESGTGEDLPEESEQ